MGGGERGGERGMRDSQSDKLEIRGSQGSSAFFLGKWLTALNACLHVHVHV